MASEEGLIIKDVDLVFIFAFDLGDKVDAKELGEAFAQHYPLVEGGWHPPEKPRQTSAAICIAAKKLGLIDSEITMREFAESRLDDKLASDVRVIEGIKRLHVLFRGMIASDRIALDPEYLELGRYTRFKLVELEAEVVEPDKVEADDRETQGRIREMVRGFRIEPYLLIHNAGIGIVTAWINLKGNFTTDDIITLEDHLDKIKLNVKDIFGNQYAITLLGFVEVTIATPLRAAVLFRDRYGDFKRVFEALRRHEIGTNEIMEGLRVKYTTGHVIFGVREVKCNDGCFTAVNVVKNHVKEVAGILTRNKRWRDYRIDKAEEDLGRNLSPNEPLAMYLAIGASLFLGSPKLSKEIEEEAAGLPLDTDYKDAAFRLRMLGLVTPVEFLVLSHKILDVYDSFFRKKREKFQERKRRGETVNPSEYMELRSELTEALEEYRNVAFFIANPPRSILEYGKERYRLREWEGVLRSALEELAELARTHYDERFAKSQLVLTVVFGIFGIFAEIEFLEKLVGLTGAAAVAALTASALRLFYRWYMGNPSFRQFLLAVVIGANIFFGMIMIFEKLIGLEREQAVVVVALIMIALTLFLTWRMDRPYVRLRIIEFEIGNLGRHSRRSRRARKTS
jgi:hypothetical protein